MKTKYGIGLLTLGTIASAAPAQERPNILVIISDDQGYGDYSAMGAGQVETPCLDRLANESRYFRNFYVEPASAPTRASLLTGKSFVRAGAWSVHYGGDYIALGHTLMPEVLHKAGYQTALIGKWHSGKGPGYLPQYRGYDVVKPVVMHDHFDNDMTFNDVPLRLEDHPYWKPMRYHGWTLDKMADEVCEYIDTPHNKPFFLQVSFVSPHAPWGAPKELVEKYKAKGQSPLFASLNALVEHMDRTVGRIVEHLDSSGLAQNTVVVFFSDNGYVHNSPQGTLSEEEIARRNPLGRRGTKGTVFEGGIWSPLMVRWPRTIDPGKTEWLGHVTDLLPTFAQLAGLGKEALPQGLDGKSLCTPLTDPAAVQDQRIICGAGLGVPAAGVKYNPPLGIGRDRDTERRKVTYEQANLYARDSRFKLVKSGQGAVLFDMQADPNESKDASPQFPGEKARLEKSLQTWFSTVAADTMNYRSPLFPIGLEPGGVLYFNGAAQLTGDMQGDGQWAHNLVAKTAGSGARWNVKVVRGGDYEVWLQAEAPRDGARVSFSAGKNRITAPLTKGDLHRLGVVRIGDDCRSVQFTLDDPAGGAVDHFWNIVLEPKNKK